MEGFQNVKLFLIRNFVRQMVSTSFTKRTAGNWTQEDLVQNAKSLYGTRKIGLLSNVSPILKMQAFHLGTKLGISLAHLEVDEAKMVNVDKRILLVNAKINSFRFMLYYN